MWFFDMVSRREALIAIGSTVAIAGCSGSDNDLEQDPENNEPTKEDIELLNHEYVVEESQYREDAYIRGEIKNNANISVSSIELPYRLYNDDGNQIGSSSTFVDNLAANTTYEFETLVLEDSEDVADYEISIGDVTF